MEGSSEVVTLAIRPGCQEASYTKAKGKAFQEEGTDGAKAHRPRHAWRSGRKALGWSLGYG